MKRAHARQSGPPHVHRVSIRGHELVVDEPDELGGQDRGPTPQELLAASLAGCTAITVQMYARRKGWEISPVEVEVSYTPPPELGRPTVFNVLLRVSDGCSDEQLERLRAIAARCPVHRTLAGPVSFSERIERVGDGASAPAD